MKHIENTLKKLVGKNNYDVDAFYMDMYDDPMVKDLELELGRSITEAEAEFVYELDILNN